MLQVLQIRLTWVTLQQLVSPTLQPFTIAGVENINITTNDTSGLATAFEAEITAASAVTVTVSGDAGFNAGSGLSATTLTTFDASGVTGTGSAGAVTFTTGVLAASATLTGGAGTNTISAAAVTSTTKVMTITGGAGLDTLTGGAGPDVISGGAGGTTGTGLDGGAGHDIITGGTGNDTIDGGTGNDTITASAGNNTVVGDTGNDIITTGAGNDIITTGTGTDTVDAGAGNDSITSAVGADIIDGGAGTDTYVTDSTQIAAAIEGAGTGTSNGMVINLGSTAVTNSAVLSATTDQHLAGNLASVASGQAAYLYASSLFTNSTVVDTLSNIENVTLTGNGDNYVVGSATANTITLSATGADIVDTGAGNDIIVAASGGYITTADILTGGAGTDALHITNVAGANAAVDDIATIESIVILDGVAAADSTVTLTFTSANTAALTIDATALEAGEVFTLVATDAEVNGALTVKGGSGADIISTGTGADIITGGAGNDSITSGLGADIINGGTGTDTYISSTTQIAANIEGAGTGTSTGLVINLGSAAITKAAVLSATTDQNVSGSLTSVVSGGVAYLFASSDAAFSTVVDTLSNVEDVTLTGNGDNYVVGSATANTITLSATGADIVDTGDGDDIIVAASGGYITAADILTGGAGTDALHITNVAGASAAVHNIATIESIVILDGVANADSTLTLTFASANTAALTIDASALDAGEVFTLVSTDAEVDGVLTVTGGAGNDVLTTGDGADIITGGLGGDTITGDVGADTIIYNAILDGTSLTTLTDITNADDDFTATAGTTTDSIVGFVTTSDKVKIDGALQTALNAVGSVDDTAILLADNGNLNYNAGSVFIFNTVDDLAADNFGDITDVVAAFNTVNTGTPANGATNQEIIFAIGNNSDNAYGVYYFKDVDGNGDISNGDQIALLAIVSAAALAAADFSFG